MFKKIVITTVAASMMVVGAAQVAAQDFDPFASGDSIAVMQGNGGPSGERGERGGPFEGRYFDGVIMELVEEYTGMTAQEVMQELRSGDTTLAALIEANDQSVDEFITEAVSAIETKIDEAVENGDLDEERAAQIKENLTDIVTAIVNGERPLGMGQSGQSRQFGNALADAEIITLIEEYTGMTIDEVREALQDDETTLASLIEANEQSVDEFITEAVALAEARIDEAVENGNLDEERATQLKENLTDIVTDLVNGERPFGMWRDGRQNQGFGMFTNEEMIALVEEYTGMTIDEVREALQDDETTLASLIEANGQSVDSFIEEATAIAGANFSEQFADHVTNFVNGELPTFNGPNGQFGGPDGGRNGQPGGFGPKGN